MSRRSRFTLGQSVYLALALCLVVVSGCATYNPDYPRSTSSVITDFATTRIGGYFADAAADHPGQSGIAILRYGRESLVARLAFVDAADKTLDLQYYIWDADISGRLLGERLVRAADRGVRVRVLLDDHSVVGRDDAIARLSGHPLVEIRAFNPYRHRSRTIDYFTDFQRINRRSHNKIFIADNALAIVGGRNIADHYFGVHGQSNYRDLDVVAVGPVVRDVSAVFDDFWNSEFAVPYAAFVDDPPTAEDAAAQVAVMRAAIADAPMPYPLDEEIVALNEAKTQIRDDLVWAEAEVLYDAPSKAADDTVRGIADKLAAMSQNAEREILIENAYLVPRKPMVQIVQSLCERGVRVRMLTNSLSSNDVPAVYAGYTKRRDDLLRAGAEVYELRPDSTDKQRWSVLSSESRAGLHTKAMVVDRAHVVIGSYNLDPRSADINSECALLVHSKAFGEQAAAYLDEGVQPQNAYHVTLEDNRTRWTTVDDEGREVVSNKPPQTGWWKRLVTTMIGWLPIESQL